MKCYFGTTFQPVVSINEAIELAKKIRWGGIGAFSSTGFSTGSRKELDTTGTQDGGEEQRRIAIGYFVSPSGAQRSRGIR